jgi:hypothetical protein
MHKAVPSPVLDTSSQTKYYSFPYLDLCGKTADMIKHNPFSRRLRIKKKKK